MVAISSDAIYFSSPKDAFTLPVDSKGFFICHL
jgi:hypothetical protein